MRLQALFAALTTLATLGQAVPAQRESDSGSSSDYTSAVTTGWDHGGAGGDRPTGDFTVTGFPSAFPRPTGGRFFYGSRGWRSHRSKSKGSYSKSDCCSSTEASSGTSSDSDPTPSSSGDGPVDTSTTIAAPDATNLRRDAPLPTGTPPSGSDRPAHSRPTGDKDKHTGIPTGTLPSGTSPPRHPGDGRDRSGKDGHPWDQTSTHSASFDAPAPTTTA